jgi:ElaB/YqjD/DUF883 family membrane-anchored ribosome-binding protein
MAGQSEREVRMEAASDKLMEEFREVLAAAEELLNATSGANGEGVQELRGRAEEALRKARTRMEGAGRHLERQVRDNPLAALCVAAAAGLVVGMLLARK